ncbi:hypothetical protein ABPG72_014530 [Tetrahymena utriculariae]
MKIFSLIVLIYRLVLCYASLPINVDQFWFQIIEDQSIIYQDSDQNQWVYSKLNQNGDITLSIKLNNFVGKSNLNDEYMIEPDNQNHRFLYIFAQNTGQYQKIDFDLLLQTQNNQVFDCQNIFQSYGEKSTRYIKRDSNYVKYYQKKISQISQKFSPSDLLFESVDYLYKYPNFFQYGESGTNFIYWKGKKYQLNGNYKSLVIDVILNQISVIKTNQFFQYENNIVLTTNKILAQFNLSSNIIAFQYQITLTNDFSNIAFTEIYSVSKVRLFGIYDNSLQFYDLNTFKQVSYSSNSDQIGTVSYFNQLFSYKNLLIVKTDVYKITYDQINNQVTLKKQQTLKQQLTLIYYNATYAIWRTSYTQVNFYLKNFFQKINFLQGQTQILQVGNQNQLISMERIICQDGQFLNSNSDCILCKLDEILQNNTCISCPQGQKKLNINDNVCFTVPSNCDKPTLQKTCECENYKYQISTQKCIQCQSGEQFSSSTDSCVQSCGDGNFFDGQACKQCNKSCKICSNDQTCDQCDSTKGYFLDNKTLIYQILILINFNILHLFIRLLCQNCSQILHLTLNNEKNACVCQNGYFLDSNNSICQKCQEGCDDCSKDQCNFCTQGYYKDTNQCKKCSANCTECSNGINCDQCDQDHGYFLDSKQNCIKCDQLNQISNSDNNSCDCQKGYFLDISSICQKCLEGCDDCSINQCNSCTQGYFIDKSSNQCQKCMPNCEQCTQTGQCNLWKTCENGKYRDKVTYECQQCHPKCKSCSGPKENNCRECFQSFFVNEEGKCSECEIGSYKEKNQCLNCHWSCKECNGPHDNNCLSCQTSLQISSENRCLTEKQKEKYDDEKIICDYSWFQQEDQESSCQQSLQYAKLNNQFVDKLSLVNLILAFIVTIFVPPFSPFAWFYIQQQQLIGNFALLKSMNIMWINQLQLKVSFGHNVINNFSNFLQKKEDKIFDFSLFDEFAFQTQPLYKFFIENTLVHASIFIVIIIIFGLLMILKSYSTFAEKLLGYIKWNLFIRFFMISSNFIILSAIIEFKQGNFSNIPSLIFFIIIGVFYLVFQIKSLRFLFSYDYYLRFFDKNTLICLKSGLIDTQRWSRLFWFIFEIRKIISCVSLYLLQDTIYGPWIILGLSIFQIVYFLIYKPLIDKKANILILIIEMMFAFVTMFISLQNYFSIQLGFSNESSDIFKAKVISGGLIAIQVFCLVCLIYISGYAFIKVVLQNRNDRLKNSFQNSQLIIEQNFKFESFDQIITVLGDSNLSQYFVISIKLNQNTQQLTSTYQDITKQGFSIITQLQGSMGILNFDIFSSLLNSIYSNSKKNFVQDFTSVELSNDLFAYQYFRFNLTQKLEDFKEQQNLTYLVFVPYFQNTNFTENEFIYIKTIKCQNPLLDGFNCLDFSLVQNYSLIKTQEILAVCNSALALILCIGIFGRYASTKLIKQEFLLLFLQNMYQETYLKLIRSYLNCESQKQIQSQSQIDLQEENQTPFQEDQPSIVPWFQIKLKQFLDQSNLSYIQSEIRVFNFRNGQKSHIQNKVGFNFQNTISIGSQKDKLESEGYNKSFLSSNFQSFNQLENNKLSQNKGLNKYNEQNQKQQIPSSSNIEIPQSIQQFYQQSTFTKKQEKKNQVSQLQLYQDPFNANIIKDCNYKLQALKNKSLAQKTLNSLNQMKQLVQKIKIPQIARSKFVSNQKIRK